MKKNLLCFLMLFVITVVSVGCNNEKTNETDYLSFNGEKYSVSSNEWYPYGDVIEQDDYLTFDNDKNNLFIRAYGSQVFDGIIYHKDSDVFPSVKTDDVDKIVLDCGTEKVEMENKYISEMVAILCAEENTDSLQETDMSSEFIFINIYYEDYPAYQCKWMIVRTADNSLGVMYCEAEENNTHFGRNKAAVINSKELTEYINNLF